MLIPSFLLRLASSESEIKKKKNSPNATNVLLGKLMHCSWLSPVLPSEEMVCMNHVAALLLQHQKKPRHCLFRLVHRQKICLLTAEKVRPITVHLYTWLAIPNYHNSYSSSCQILIFKEIAVALAFLKFLKEFNLAWVSYCSVTSSLKKHELKSPRKPWCFSYLK